MALNQKLTRVIAGRTVVGIDTDAAQSVVHFDDGSRMAVKLAAPPALVSWLPFVAVRLMAWD